MSHLAPLIADLALILICAGIMTLLFKKLKQPLGLGVLSLQASWPVLTWLIPFGDGYGKHTDLGGHRRYFLAVCFGAGV